MSQDIDILDQINNLDLSKVETSFPILATGNVLCNVLQAVFTKDEEKGAAAKPYLDVKFALAQDWRTQAVDGIPSKTISPGQRGSEFSQRIYVGTYVDKKTGETKMYGVDTLAKLRESAFGIAPEGTRFNPAHLIGQQVTVKLTFNPAPKNKDTGEVYGPRTEITGYVRKAAGK